MSENERWDYIIQLDEELLQGGVILSEWTIFLVKDSDIAFCAGAHLAAILACQAAIESHLRFDHYYSTDNRNFNFFQLIEQSSLSTTLKDELHQLRLFRNKWVHVRDPSNDVVLFERPKYYTDELFEVSKACIKVMRRILYNNPCI